MGEFDPGAGEGNRTLVISLEGFCSAIELPPPPLYRVPTYWSPSFLRRQSARLHGGGGWIRTNVGARPTDLQSATLSRSGPPPREPKITEFCRRFVKKIAAFSRPLSLPPPQRPDPCQGAVAVEP